MTPLLLINDDEELTSILSTYLSREGFAVATVHDGLAGTREAVSGQYALVVLDVMMPRISGMETLRRIRAQSRVPVLMLTARGDNLDRIVGLDMGADDYVPKPCTPAELVARIRAILRRTLHTEETADPLSPTGGRQHLSCGPLTLSPGSRSASWHGAALDLTGTEFNLLEVLTRHAGEVVSKEHLSLQVFGQPVARFDRRIDVHISSIRQKLGMRPDKQSWIQTIRGKGYQLLEP